MREWSGTGIPSSIPWTGTVLRVACGANHVVAVLQARVEFVTPNSIYSNPNLLAVQPDKTPETVRVWGANDRGQLGLGYCDSAYYCLFSLSLSSFHY